jgi:signal transduction histidine kinase
MSGRGELEIETIVEDGEVQVAIQDSGPGIPAEVVSRIFEPFFTTKGKGEGTGLGLAISARIVEKHGGRIRVVSRPGCTRFEVRLPVDGPPPTIAVGAAAGAGVPKPMSAAAPASVRTTPAEEPTN